MKIFEKLRRIPSVYAEDGLGGLGRAVAGRLLEHTEFVATQLDLRVPPLPTSCTLSFQLRRVDDAQFERFKTMPAPLPRHFEYRFRYGMRNCYAAWIGDDLGAVMWPVFQADNTTTVTRWRYLLPDEARVSNIWASPKFRGTGLIDACFERFEKLFREAGFRYAYTFTWVGNQGSRKLATRRGYREIGTIHRFSFRWQREGSGFYLRPQIPRDSLEPCHPNGDMDLPEVIG